MCTGVIFGVIIFKQHKLILWIVWSFFSILEHHFGVVLGSLFLSKPTVFFSGFYFLFFFFPPHGKIASIMSGQGRVSTLSPVPVIEHGGEANVKLAQAQHISLVIHIVLVNLLYFLLSPIKPQVQHFFFFFFCLYLIEI